ncbi:hypothetical protein E3N88_32287 [Mikania micrantha]|uniref:Retrovirus-related Pol polyprotein from transposon TNT 1-94-like beta-barrel domain-containing protein n=1 Tax=Mikania micrantha TaxID=192012 RepID=A0A5N6MAQ3_9ASTR|nr:hypothetical protein E3N88_32287 [Mikania micrantha]
MALLASFSAAAKTSHYAHKFGFTLCPTNYSFWKAMIKPFLITNNLFGYIDGTIPCPPQTLPATTDKDEPMPNPNYLIWIANDAHVRTLLTSTVSEASFTHVQGETSRDLWLSLERAYAPHTSSREFTLKTQLLRIAMHVSHIFNELHALLSDHDFMIKKTPPDVSPAQAFVAVNSSCPPPTPLHNPTTTTADPITSLHQLVSQLTNQLQSITTTSAPQAFYTNQNHSSRGRGRSHYRGGRTTGHNHRPQMGGGTRNQFTWASNQNTVYGTCNRCGIGHLPSQCPNRDPSTIRGQRHTPTANYTDFRSHASSYNWLPNTGSSNHVAPYLSGFETSEPYYGEDNLHVGNGKALPILYIGSTKLYSPSKTFSLNNILHVPAIKTNLLSVQQFCKDNNVFFEFHANFFSCEGQGYPRNPPHGCK